MIEGTIKFKANDKESLVKVIERLKSEVETLKCMNAHVSIDVANFRRGVSNSSIIIDIEERK